MYQLSYLCWSRLESEEWLFPMPYKVHNSEFQMVWNSIFHKSLFSLYWP